MLVDPFAVALVSTLAFVAYLVSGTSTEQKRVIDTTLEPIVIPAPKYRTPMYGYKDLEDATKPSHSVIALRKQTVGNRLVSERAPVLSDSGTKTYRGIHTGNAAVISLNTNAADNVKNQFYDTQTDLGQRGMYTLQPHPIYGRGFAVNGHQNEPARAYNPAFMAVDVF